MSDKRMIPLDQINKMIDERVKEYESDHEDEKAEALNDFKIDINDPQAIEDVTENVDQTIHVEHAKKIIKDGL